MMTIFSLLRIKSWVKNGFIILPAVFTFNLFHFETIFHLLIGFVSFSLTCSSIYIINDIQDRDRDVLHPRKKLRPIASGTVSIRSAYITAVLCLGLGLLISIFLISNRDFTFLMIGYVLINISYSLGLKDVPLLELIIVATNFVLRVLAGCFIIKDAPSNWILVVTFFMAFFLVVVKRKAELFQLMDQAVAHRKSLTSYTSTFLNVLIYLSATITITSYLLYTMDPIVIDSLGTPHMLYSTLFVLLGIVRYVQINELSLYDGEGDPTTLLFKDRFLQACIFSWLLFLIIVIYVL